MLPYIPIEVIHIWQSKLHISGTPKAEIVHSIYQKCFHNISILTLTRTLHHSLFAFPPFALAPAQVILSPLIMKCLCIRCSISSFTEFRDADAPVISRVITGCTDISPDMDAISIDPPATLRKGRTPSRTTFIWSSFRGGPSGIACRYIDL